MKDLKTAHEDFLVREKETHRSQLAHLEKEISTLKVELGASQRERLVLREVIDQDPLIRAAAGTRIGYDLWITGGMLWLLVIALLLLAYRYRVVNDRLQRLTLECVSEIRQNTGEHLFD